jgi:hypothetical protein
MTAHKGAVKVAFDPGERACGTARLLALATRSEIDRPPGGAIAPDPLVGVQALAVWVRIGLGSLGVIREWTKLGEPGNDAHCGTLLLYSASKSM